GSSPSVSLVRGAAVLRSAVVTGPLAVLVVAGRGDRPGCEVLVGRRVLLVEVTGDLLDHGEVERLRGADAQQVADQERDGVGDQRAGEGLEVTQVPEAEIGRASCRERVVVVM